ncbi:MAG TPA: universal stress protein, partial [Sandaracinaceae bacterium]
AELAAKEALLERVPQAVKDAGLEVACEVRHGDPASEILAVDAHVHPDLIVLATHGRRGLSRWILGSVAQRVMAAAKADVLAVRAREPAGG